MSVFFPLPGNSRLAAELAALTGGRLGELEARRFPDGESYLRVHTHVEQEEAFVVCTLDRPDEKLLPLIFAARTLRDLGAERLCLVAPYLAYMRQDRVFAPGEALTARYFADLLGSAFDEVVTVDPHLHRFRHLDQLYAIPGNVVHAAPLLADWIARNIERPLVLGPDAESEQWVSEIAASAGAPHAVFAKERLGDREVRLVLPDLGRWRGLRPVLVDDIISSGTTILAAASALAEAGFERPVCLAVHALFDEATAVRLADVVSDIATVDTIEHPTNRFAIAPLLAAGLVGRRRADHSLGRGAQARPE